MKEMTEEKNPILGSDDDPVYDYLINSVKKQPVSTAPDAAITSIDIDIDVVNNSTGQSKHGTFSLSAAEVALAGTSKRNEESVYETYFAIVKKQLDTFVAPINVPNPDGFYIITKAGVDAKYNELP